MMEESIEKDNREEMAIAIKSVIPEKAAGPFKVCEEIMSASEEDRNKVMLKLYQHVVDGKEMPDE